MKLVDLKVNDFIKEVDSNTPAPGGGSVSALASNLGCALGRMVAHLSFGKKAYNNLDDEQKEEFEKAFSELESHMNKLNTLVDEDTRAYGLVMDAYKLPKETDEEKAKRKEAIQANLKIAANTPFSICEYSKKALVNLRTIIKYGNKNAITDIGVATLLLFTGIEGGMLNVKINLLSIEDEEYKSEINSELEDIMRTSIEIKGEIMETVNKGVV